MIKVSQAEKMQHKRAMEKWWFGNSETNTSGRNEKAKTTVKKNAYMIENNGSAFKHSMHSSLDRSERWF